MAESQQRGGLLVAGALCALVRDGALPDAGEWAQAGAATATAAPSGAEPRRPGAGLGSPVAGSQS